MADITVDALLHERALLESRIAEAIAPMLTRFRERVGVSVRNVDVRLVDVTRVGDRNEHHVLGNVSVVLAI